MKLFLTLVFSFVCVSAGSQIPKHEAVGQGEFVAERQQMNSLVRELSKKIGVEFSVRVEIFRSTNRKWMYTDGSTVYINEIFLAKLERWVADEGLLHTSLHT